MSLLGSLPLKTDGVGSGLEDLVRTGGDISYEDTDGVLQVAKASGTNILLHSADTSNWTGSGPWTQTVAITVGWWQVEAHLTAATITVVADTATIDASASTATSTSDGVGYDLFYCSGAGDVTVTTDTADPKGMLYETSGMEYGPDLTVVGITKASPGVVTITGHGLSTDDWVYFSGLTEMTELNGHAKQIIKVDADTFSINDTSGYVAAETTGGACANLVPNYTNFLPRTYTVTAGVSASIPAEIPIGANGFPKAPESGYVNLLIHSDDFNGEWSGTYTTAAQYDGPDRKTLSASIMTDDATQGNRYITEGAFVAIDNLQYCISVFVKKIDGEPFSLIHRDTDAVAFRSGVDFEWSGSDLQVKSEDVGTGGVEEWADGWWRAWAVCPASVVVGANENKFYIYTSEKGVTPSATCSTAIYRANITQSSYPLPPLKSEGSRVAAKPETTSVEISGAAALIAALDAEATILLKWTPQFNAADATGDVEILNFDSGAPCIYYDATNNMLEITDGTNTSTVALECVRNTQYLVAGRADDTPDAGAGDLNIAFAVASAPTVWTADASDLDFDGNFVVDDAIRFGEGSEYPQAIQGLRAFDEWLTDAQLPGAFADTVYDSDGGTISYLSFSGESVGFLGSETVSHCTFYDSEVYIGADKALTDSILYDPDTTTVEIATGVTVTGTYNILGCANSFDGTYSDSGLTSYFSTNPLFQNTDDFLIKFLSDGWYGASDGTHIGSCQRGVITHPVRFSVPR